MHPRLTSALRFDPEGDTGDPTEIGAGSDARQAGLV